MLDAKVSQLVELVPRYANQQSFYGKALVAGQNGYKVLYSYMTPVAKVADDKQVITSDRNLLSNTTMRHVHEFINQYGIEDLPKQQLIKKYGGKI